MTDEELDQTFGAQFRAEYNKLSDEAAYLLNAMTSVYGVGYCVTYPFPHEHLYSFKMPGGDAIGELIRAGFIHAIPVAKPPFHHYAMDLHGIQVATTRGCQRDIRLGEADVSDPDADNIRKIGVDGKILGALILDGNTAEFKMVAATKDFSFKWVVPDDYASNPVAGGLEQQDWLEKTALFALNVQIIPTARHLI